MKNLVRYFLQGAVIIGPIAATAYVVYAIVTSVDSWLGIDFPGMGFVLTVAVITLTGFFASNVIVARVLKVTEQVLSRLPIIKLLYNAFRDLLEAFVGNKKNFDQPVAVDLANGGTVFGFLTCEQIPAEGFEEHVAVYFPQSYNVAGHLVMVPKTQVRRLQVTSSRLMTFIVSGGVADTPTTELSSTEESPANTPQLGALANPQTREKTG